MPLLTGPYYPVEALIQARSGNHWDKGSLHKTLLVPTAAAASHPKLSGSDNQTHLLSPPSETGVSLLGRCPSILPPTKRVFTGPKV
jgi:hypothetical protein